MDSKTLAFPQEPCAGKRQRLEPGASLSGGLVSWKEISHRADNPSEYLAGGTGAETRMGWSWQDHTLIRTAGGTRAERMVGQ